MIPRVFLPVLLAAFLAGCNRPAQSEAAVRQGVIDYLSQRQDLNMSQMDVDVSSVSFRANEADATVSIRPKGSGAGQGMQVRYTLERQGNRWVVKGKGQSGGHGSQMPGAPREMPPGHPPTGQDQGTAQPKQQ